MDIKKLKYMKKLAMKYAKYDRLSTMYDDKEYEAWLNDKERDHDRYRRKAAKYRSKGYYLKKVYDLEVAILGATHNINTESDVL